MGAGFSEARTILAAPTLSTLPREKPHPIPSPRAGRGRRGPPPERGGRGGVKCRGVVRRQSLRSCVSPRLSCHAPPPKLEVRAEHSTAKIRLKTKEERVFVPWNPTLARWLLYVGAKRWAGGKHSQALSDDTRDGRGLRLPRLVDFYPFEARPRLFMALAFALKRFA